MGGGLFEWGAYMNGGLINLEELWMIQNSWKRSFIFLNTLKELSQVSCNYLNRTNFRAEKFSRFTRILPKFAKLNPREIFANSQIAKLNPREIFANSQIAKLNPREIFEKTKFAKLKKQNKAHVECFMIFLDPVYAITKETQWKYIHRVKILTCNSEEKAWFLILMTINHFSSFL